MKKVLALVLTLIVAMGCLAGCGGSDSSAESSGSEAASTDEVIVMRCASVENTERVSVALLYEFEKAVEERTGGRVDVQIYPDGQLGSDQECLEGALMGDIQLTLPGATNLDIWHDKFSMLDIPYLISDWEQATAVSEGAAGDYYKTSAEEYGFKVFGLGADGGRCIFNRLNEVNSMADLSGMKIRVLESNIYLKTFGALGMNPTPMAFSEVYTGLSQGTVDACSSLIGLQWDSGLNDVAPYALFDYHFFQNLAYIGSVEWYNALPDDIRAIIDEEMATMIASEREQELAKEDGYKQKFYENATVSEMTDDMRAEFRAAVTPVYEEYRGLMGDECTDILLEACGLTGLF